MGNKTTKRKPAVKHTKSATNAVVKSPVKTGRPLFISTPQEMQSKIDAYFEKCKPTFLTVEGQLAKNKDGSPIVVYHHPTVTGLALFLGFNNRTSLWEYTKRPAFSDTVKRAIARIEQYAENQLFDNPKPTGAIFWLKNHGWKAEEDKSLTLKAPVIVDDIEDDEDGE